MGNSSYLQKLAESMPLREPALRKAIKILSLPEGSRGLDAGCGIGSLAILLAETVGPESRIDGLDQSAEFLSHARISVDKAGLANRVFFKQGDINNIPFEDNNFDWLISVDCAGYPSGNPEALIKELTRVVKPGGIIAVMAWSSQQLLPGYPFLEASLNATPAGIAPFNLNTSPDRHIQRALGWFKNAGLIDATAHTIVHDFQAPLDEEVRIALLSLIEMRWEGAKGQVSEELWDEYLDLSNPESKSFILDLPDYYAFFTYSLFKGRKNEE